MAKLRTVFCAPSSELTAVELASGAVSAGCVAIALADGPELTAEALDEIRALGVSIECLSCPEPLAGDSLSRLLSRAAKLQIPHVLVPPGPADHSYSQAYDQLYSLLYEIAPTADQLAVKLLVCAPQAAFLLSPLEVRQLIDAVNSPNVGCCLSFEHCLAHQLCIAHWIGVLNARLFACRISSASDMAGELSALWAKLPTEPFCLTTEASVVS
ncbi:MAG: TIM barrel protein [Phycisphaerae bacterium]|nr:TIM barrel protein [Phycisphaerae bacterium]